MNLPVSTFHRLLTSIVVDRLILFKRTKDRQSINLHHEYRYENSLCDFTAEVELQSTMIIMFLFLFFFFSRLDEENSFQRLIVKDWKLKTCRQFPSRVHLFCRSLCRCFITLRTATHITAFPMNRKTAGTRPNITSWNQFWIV